MNRRTFIKIVSSLSVVTATGYASEADDLFFGAIQPDRISNRIKFRDAFPTVQGISKAEQRAYLWKFLEIVTGPLKPNRQTWEGDCVGHTYGVGADVIAACDIFLNSELEKFLDRASVEMIYAGSRVQIGENSIFGAGSRGEWAAKFVSQYGVLHRIPYKIGDFELNLQGYSPQRSRDYRSQGVPEPLISVAKEHPCKTYSKVLTPDECKDALCVGQPILLCSTYAFRNVRDQNGFAKQYTGRRRKRWYHAMPVIGYDDLGFLLLNSWPEDWISGPKRAEQPDGSFWITPEELNRMLNDWNDCYAISSYTGHPLKRLNHKLY